MIGKICRLMLNDNCQTIRLHILYRVSTKSVCTLENFNFICALFVHTDFMDTLYIKVAFFFFLFSNNFVLISLHYKYYAIFFDIFNVWRARLYPQGWKLKPRGQVNLLPCGFIAIKTTIARPENKWSRRKQNN